ncbi:MAG: hypothetical protein EOP85_21505 [Verrucomicrobiaceae bacterium]|nr:MAG: hypothetical protein EOP85_21505 [Verrucomicrobiaceae bacterium]
MKIPGVTSLIGILLVSSLQAQTTEIPANPLVPSGKTNTRAIGGGTNPGASVVPSRTQTRLVTHIVLSESRMWTSSDGKPLEAKLIAFEDMVAKVPEGSSAPAMPTPPANPTVVRDGSARLLVNKKPVVLPLERLSAPDRELIERIRLSIAKKAAGQ